MLQTEITFTLPCGLIDPQGNLHRQGIMRRATALDEVDVQAHPRVRANEAYASIALLSRVITRLGSLAPVGSSLVEGLFAEDFTYLQDLYLELNLSSKIIETRCPACGAQLRLELNNHEPHNT